MAHGAYRRASEMSRRRRNGFTLLEVLVALAVLGLLMAGLAQGMRVGITTWTTQLHASSGRSDLEAAQRTLRTLLARMDPGGVSLRPPTFVGGARRLTFTTSMHGYGDTLELRDQDVTMAVDAAHQLELAWLPHDRRGAASTESPQRVVLLQDLDHLELSYWQNPKDGWQTEWRGSSLPKLIRIRVVFAGSHGLHPPDIVIAPMRDRWQL